MWENYLEPTSRSYVNNIHAKQRSRQKALQFRKLPSKKRHKPSRKKIRNTTYDQDSLKETIQSSVDEKKLPDVEIDW